MVVKKKAVSKKKKAASKKKRSVQAKTVKASVVLPKLELNMPLDAKKKKAIERCLAKGKLNIKISKLDIAAGRMGAAYIYD